MTPLMSPKTILATCAIALMCSSLTSSCDQVTEDACSNGPPDGQASYFPGSLDQSWVYDYNEINRPLGSASTVRTGVLTWSVIEREDNCSSAQLVLKEQFQGEEEVSSISGDTTYAVSWDTTRSVRLEEEKLIIEGYTDSRSNASDPINWIWPISSPELVEVSVRAGCGFGGCVDIQYGLQRNKGIAYFYYQNTTRINGPYSRRITLKEEE